MQEQKILNVKVATDIFKSWWKANRERGGRKDIEITSLPELNDVLWGLQKGKMLVIGGRTSQGKTTLALQLALDAAAQGKRVNYFSLEQDEEELIARVFSHVTQLPLVKVVEDADSYKAEAETFYKHLKDNLKIFFTYNIGTVVDELEETVETLEPDVVILDYIQAIRKLDTDKLSTMNEYIMRFRSQAVRQKFCGILVSQINREAENVKPNLWQLKGSGTIEEHADQVLLCHWKYFYTKKEVDRNHFEILVAKNRQGKAADIVVHYEPEIFKFSPSKPTTFEVEPEISWGKRAAAEPTEPIGVEKTLDLFGGKVVNE